MNLHIYMEQALRGFWEEKKKYFVWEIETIEEEDGEKLLPDIKIKDPVDETEKLEEKF